MHSVASRLQAGVLPYLDVPSLGPITAFGVLAMLGMYFSGAAVTRHGARLGLPSEQTRKMWLYCGVGGLLGAHYLDLFLYQPGWYAQSDAVWRFIYPFAGISSYGGILGGTLGFLVWARKQKGRRLRYAETAAIGVVVLMTFGRAGCATAHDHVGVASNFVLAMEMPQLGGPHHDLGLYEFLMFAVVLLPASWWILRTPKRAGLYVGVIAIAYAVPRFFLDDLRREIDNPRYFALTPAQWCCIATAIAGVVLLARVRRMPAPEPYLRSA
jgi:phosphatidylglycerol:prolipoprotein diacylglycerol transferase